jgi:hypothetical protein
MRISHGLVLSLMRPTMADRKIRGGFLKEDAINAISLDYKSQDRLILNSITVWNESFMSWGKDVS